MGETIAIPTSTFFLLTALSIYGLFVSGVMLSVVVTSIVQRHTMWREMRRFMLMMTDEPQEEALDRLFEVDQSRSANSS